MDTNRQDNRYKPIKYTIGYLKLDYTPTRAYIEDLNFHQILAINPHNIIIRYIIVNASHGYRFYLYIGNGILGPAGVKVMSYITGIIDMVNKNGVLTSEEKDELLHLTNLWLTKFVPHFIEYK